MASRLSTSMMNLLGTKSFGRLDPPFLIEESGIAASAVVALSREGRSAKYAKDLIVGEEGS